MGRGRGSGLGLGRGRGRGHGPGLGSPRTRHLRRPVAAFPAHRLLAHELALEAAAETLAIAARVPPRLRSVADQLVRSATSVPANLAEGRGRRGRDRVHHFRIAYGSALEASSHLELLAAAGAPDRVRVQRALALLDRVRALTWRMIHPGR